MAVMRHATGSASHAASFSEQSLETLTYNKSPTTTDTRPSVIQDILFKDGPKFTGKDSLLVSAGDNQMGALPMLGFTSTSVDYGTMAALGYDATTLGNHELDFGPKALARSINVAKAAKALPPIVASNIHFSDASADDDDVQGPVRVLAHSECTSVTTRVSTSGSVSGGTP